MKPLKTIADLTPDDRNLNVHTERGMGRLAKSLEQFGAGRFIATYEKTRKPGEEHIQTVAAREKRRRWRGMTTDDAAGALAARE